MSSYRTRLAAGALAASAVVSPADYPLPTSLPPHSWATVGEKTYAHGCKADGPLNETELALVAKFPLLTVEKGQGLQLPGNAEEKMYAVSKQYKDVRPDGWTIFYSNGQFDWEFYGLHDTMLQNPDWWLRDQSTGEACRMNGDRTFPQPDEGLLVFNHSNPDMRSTFVELCKNATQAGFDGCFVDCSNAWLRCAAIPMPRSCNKCGLTTDDYDLLAEGEATLLEELQAMVTSDRLIVAKDGGTLYEDSVRVNSIFLSDAFCSCYDCVWDTKNQDKCNIQIAFGIKTGQFGQVVLLHGEFNAHVAAPSDQEQFTFVLAAFLVIAEDTTFLGYSDGWYYNGTTWHEEYDRPLGAPTGPASVDANGVWYREFEGGVTVSLDVANYGANISWPAHIAV